MANVQIDHGDYTRIANPILEQIVKTKLNGTQYSIIITIWRYTYGFQRCNHEFSLSYLAEAIGVNHKEQIKRELDELIDRKIITVVKEATFCGSRVLKFNKNYEQWECTEKLPVNKKVHSTVNEKVHSTVNQLVHQEKKVFKENIKEIYMFYLETLKVDRKLTKLREDKIKARLKEFTKSELKQAIVNLSKDEFITGKNDRNKFYAEIEYVFRSTEKTEQWINANQRAPNPNAGIKM